MLGYVTVGTRDLLRAVKFYDAIAKEMDTPRMMEFETFVAWGTMADQRASPLRCPTTRTRRPSATA